MARNAGEIQDLFIEKSGNSKLGQSLQITIPGFTLQSNPGKLANTLNPDQAGIFQFFQMMGNGGRSQTRTFADTGTAWRIFGSSNLLEHLKSFGIRESLADEMKLLVINFHFTCSHAQFDDIVPLNDPTGECIMTALP